MIKRVLSLMLIFLVLGASQSPSIIEFDSQIIRVGAESDSVIRIIESIDELEALYFDANISDSRIIEEKDLIAKYDEKFFAAKSILLFRLVEGSGTIGHAVKGVTNEGGLTVTVNRLLPPKDMPCTTDCAGLRFFIELDKAAIAGVQESDVNIKVIDIEQSR